MKESSWRKTVGSAMMMGTVICLTAYLNRIQTPSLFFLYFFLFLMVSHWGVEEQFASIFLITQDIINKYLLYVGFDSCFTKCSFKPNNKILCCLVAASFLQLRRLKHERRGNLSKIPQGINLQPKISSKKPEFRAQ